MGDKLVTERHGEYYARPRVYGTMPGRGCMNVYYVPTTTTNKSTAVLIKQQLLQT